VSCTIGHSEFNACWAGRHLAPRLLYEGIMVISLLEKPAIYRKEQGMVVIFPSRPYWFSATQEISEVLSCFEQKQPEKIVDQIAKNLRIRHEEAKGIYQEVFELLHTSGVLAVDGSVAEKRDYQPDFQVNEVENVLVIATTQSCNMSCPMCYALANHKPRREMTTGEVKHIIDQLAEMPWNRKVSRVALTGGELFTRPDAIDLMRYVHEQGFSLQVNTNATIISSEQIRMMSKLVRLKVSVSLDGCESLTHELIRGPGTFDATVGTIRSMTQSGISVGVNMLVHQANLHQIKETLFLVQSLSVSAFNCLNLMNVGRGATNRTKNTLGSVPLAVLYRKIYEALKDNKAHQQLMQNSTFANQLMGVAAGVKSYGCGIGTNRAVYIKPDGSLYPCADTALPVFRLGNLLTQKLSDIWESSPILHELRSLSIDTMNPDCASCDVRYFCGGNCRGEHYQNTKDLKGPHFKCREIHDSIIELMWILTENPNLFKNKVQNLYDSVSSHASQA
jgi:mycofactocin biosynthetic radical S-adenosylmethionine protein MftC